MAVGGIIALAIAALLTRVGFALYAVGLVRAKSSVAVMIRLIADLCISVLGFWAIGAAVRFQSTSEWFGINPHFLLGLHLPPSAQPQIVLTLQVTLFVFFVMLLTATGAVGGAVAERFRFFPLCLVTFILAALVIPTMGNWVWGGWLARRGFVDLAGGAAIHVPAGIFAALAVAVAGPRAGKFNRDGSSSTISGHNIPLAAIGVLVLLVGWIAYVSFGTNIQIALTALNVLLSASAAGFASMLYSQFRFGKPDAILILTGLFGGLVSTCAGAATMPTWGAVLTGGVAGVIVPLAAVNIDLRLRLDDPLGVIAIHGVGGAWGTLAAGIFIEQPVTYAQTRLSQIGVQLTGLIAIFLFSTIVGGVCMFALKSVLKLKLKPADEFDGLDLAQHEISGYPDFQQSTIK